MARLASAGTGPASSTGSPMTLMMRPSVPRPTGTAIGSPVSRTSWPRVRPSEVSMATQRTVDSPSCWATSRTRRLPWFWVSSAFRISGRWPSNFTSTTAPITCVMRPVALAPGCPAAGRVMVSSAIVSSLSLSSLERLGARDDLDQFLGDLGLARAVVERRLLLDHVAGVAGGVVHGAHARALLGGRVLEEGAEDLDREIARKQALENLVLAGLVLVDGLAIRATAGADLGRDDLLRRRDLGDDRLEARVEQRRDVELAVLEPLEDLPRHHVGVLEAELARAAQVDEVDDAVRELPPQDVVAFLADADDLDVLAVGQKPVGVVAGKARDRRVEGAAQPALGGADDEEMHAVLAGARQQPWRLGTGDEARGKVAEHLAHMLRVRPRRLRGALRTTQFCRRDHLHGLCDLLRRLHRSDAVAQILQRRHGSTFSPPPCGEGSGVGVAGQKAPPERSAPRPPSAPFGGTSPARREATNAAFIS